MSKAVAERPIVVIAGDPGGAAALVPVIRRIKEDSIAPLHIFGYKEASKIWRDAALEIEIIPNDADDEWMTGHLAGAGLLLVGTSVNGIDRERTATRLAGRLGIPSLAVLDYWTNYRQRFADPLGNLVLPDRIAVMDALACTEMEAKGFPRERLVITGQPALDRLAEARRVFTPLRRRALRSDLGLGEMDRLVLFVSQPFADIHGGLEGARAALGFDEKEVLEVVCRTLARLAQRIGMSIVLAIRPHPRESAGKFPKIREDGFQVTVWGTPDPLEASLSADLILGMNSILLYEAALLGCPVISVQPNIRGTDPLPSNRSGLSSPVYDISQLEPTLEEALSGPDRRAGIIRRSNIAPPVRSAALSVVAEVRKLFGEPSI